MAAALCKANCPRLSLARTEAFCSSNFFATVRLALLAQR